MRGERGEWVDSPRVLLNYNLMIDEGDGICELSPPVAVGQPLTPSG
jgi:hypothetical protein